MAFDTRSESHCALPKLDFAYKNAKFEVEVLGGCLCLLYSQKRYKIDVWLMKEYRVKESWTKLLRIAPPLIKPYDILCSLVYSKDGTKVLLNHGDKRLIWYDLKKKTVTHVSVNGLPSIFYAEACTESLVSVDGFGDDNCFKERSKGKQFKGKRDDFLSKGSKLVL